MHRPVDYAKMLKLLVGDLDLPKKKDVYQQSRGGGRCTGTPLWQSNRVEFTQWQNVKVCLLYTSPSPRD